MNQIIAQSIGTETSGRKYFDNTFANLQNHKSNSVKNNDEFCIKAALLKL